MTRSAIPGTAVAAAVLVAGLLLALMVGRYPVSFAELFSAIAGKLTGHAPAVPSTVDNVVWQVRGPRVASAALVGAALAIAANVVPGVKVSSFWILLLAAVALASASYLIEPLLFFLTMPINIASFGAFSVVVSGLVVMITARFVPGFHVKGILWGLLPAIATALIISLCRVVLRSILVQLYSKASRQ